MSKPNLPIFLLLLGLLAGCGGESPPARETAPEGLDLQDGEKPIGGFGIVSPQLAASRAREVAPKVARIISFRMPEEKVGYDEASVVAAAGGEFVQLGFTEARLEDPALREQAYALFDEAARAGRRLTWLHCSSGNRAAALWALYRAEVEGKPVEEAIADGKAAGLTALEPLVREILGAK